MGCSKRTLLSFVNVLTGALDQLDTSCRLRTELRRMIFAYPLQCSAYLVCDFASSRR